MSKKFSARADELRRQLAQEAARVMAQQGIDDFLHAKRKAAERLGMHDVSVLPKNAEIEAALREYQRLFAGDAHRTALKEQRRTALSAMRMLREFEPRLVGSVLNGTATGHGDIDLHVFADAAETIVIRFMDMGIAHEVRERRVRMDAERSILRPAIRFDVEAWTIDATVFPVDGIRQAPYSPVDFRPMRRANADEVRELIEAT